jgi:predicted PurR-regulated permease PerM
MPYQLSTRTLVRIAATLFCLWLFFAGLVYAEGFLLPLAFASVLAMLLWPVGKKLESWGLARKWASLLSVLAMVLVVVGIFLLLGTQIQTFGEKLPELKEQFSNQLSKLEQVVADKLGIPKEKQQEMISGASTKPNEVAKAAALNVLGGLATTLLVLVYIFLLLLYRNRFKEFILKYIEEESQPQARKVIEQAASVAKNYLAGRLFLMTILGIIYTLGLSLIGTDQALFFGVLAAILAIVPYIGNIIGATFPIAMALGQGDTTQALYIVILFSAVQLIENYVLEPLVVGRKVDLNAFFAIAIVILGEIIWGVPGAILAMPILGIFKIIFDHVTEFKPLGYVIGENDDSGNSDSSSNLINKLKGIFNK